MITKSNEQKSIYEKLLKKLKLSKSILEDPMAFELIDKSIQANNMTILEFNDTIEKSIGKYDPTKSFFNLTNAKKTITEFDFKEITSDKEYDNHKLNCTSSEKYFKNVLDEQVDMFNFKPELSPLVNYRNFNIVAKVIHEEVIIYPRNIANLIKKLISSFQDKKYAEYYLIRSGMIIPGDIGHNIKTLEFLNKPEKITNFGNKRESHISFHELAKLSYLNDGTERAFNPIWQCLVKDIPSIRTIGGFSINENGLVCNVHIEKDYRGIRVGRNDLSIAQTIFDFVESKAKLFGHKILYISTKNEKMLHLIKKNNYTIIGATDTPVSWQGQTIPYDICAYKVVDPDIDYTDLIARTEDAFINMKLKTLFISETVREKVKTPEITKPFGSIDNVNQFALEYLAKNKESIQDLDYIGTNFEENSIHLYSPIDLLPIRFKTLFFELEDRVYKYPLFGGTQFFGEDITSINWENKAYMHYLQEFSPEVLYTEDKIIILEEVYDTVTVSNDLTKDIQQRKIHPTKRTLTRRYNIPKEYHDDDFLVWSGLLYGSDIMGERYSKLVKDAGKFNETENGLLSFSITPTVGKVLTILQVVEEMWKIYNKKED